MKNSNESFLLSLDLNLWHIVKSGFKMSSLPMNHWNDLEKKMFSLNVKVIRGVLILPLQSDLLVEVGSLIEEGFASGCRSFDRTTLNLCVP